MSVDNRKLVYDKELARGRTPSPRLVQEFGGDKREEAKEAPVVEEAPKKARKKVKKVAS